MHSSSALRSLAAGEDSSSTTPPAFGIPQEQDEAQLLPCIDNVLTMFDRIKGFRPSLPFRSEEAAAAAATTTDFNLCQDSTIQLEDFLDAIAASPSRYIAIQCGESGGGSDNNSSNSNNNNGINKGLCRIVATEPPPVPATQPPSPPSPSPPLPSNETPSVDQSTMAARTVPDDPNLFVVVGVASLLGMFVTALLVWLCTLRRRRRRSSTTTKWRGVKPNAPPLPRRSSASAVAQQALAEQQREQQRRSKQGGGADIEESIIDVYTETEEEEDGDDNDDGDTTDSHVSQETRQQRVPNESSVLSGLTVADSAARSRLSSNGDEENWTADFGDDEATIAGYSTTGGGDETSIAGYSISAAVDAGTVLGLPPSVGVERQPPPPEPREDYSVSPSVASLYSSQAAAATSPLVVQRTIKAPPGKLGVTLAVTSEGPKVRSVKVGSPIEGLVFAGDIVIAINDTNTRALSTPEIYKLLEQTNDGPRSITMLSIDDVTRHQKRPPPLPAPPTRNKREQQRR